MRQRTRLFTATVLLGMFGLLSACSSTEPAPAAKDQSAPAPKQISAEERVKWYQDCWETFNQKKWPEFKQCYSATGTSQNGMGQTFSGPDAIVADAENFTKALPDVRGDGQLILSNGTHIAGVYLLTGTNSGPLTQPDGKQAPATNKKIGLLFGHTMELERDANKGTKEFGVLDDGTFASQLGLSKNPARPLMQKGEGGPKVVIAKNDATETQNVSADRASMDAWSKHDSAGYYAAIADDVVLHDMTAPKDKSKAESMESDKAFWKGFSDAKLNISSMWGAGDYVVIEGTFEGTNDGDSPALNLKKTGKKVSVPFLSIDRFESGKIKEGWLFFNSAYFASQLGMK